MTPDDVIFSFKAFKKNSPYYSAYYRHVVKVEKTGDHEVTFTFDGPGNRELPQIVGELIVLPKHWWEGADKNGKKRDIGETTLEPPLGCGAYRIKEFSPGRTIVYERVKDYWGKDLNVNIGRDNFDELRFEYFRDTTVALEAFKADTVDWRTENSAKNWATAYDFPAVTDNRVLHEEFPIRELGLMQAFAFNTRRAKFQDPRVRRAFNYAFDFEEMNKQIFFGQYTRIASYFQGTRACLPPACRQDASSKSWKPCATRFPPRCSRRPTPIRSAATRRTCATICAKRCGCSKAAGYEVRDQQLVNTKTGEPYTVEFLAEDPSFERVFLFYKPSLDRLGIGVTVRTVDACAIREPAAQLGFRHHHLFAGRIAVARQRTARLLGLAGRRPGRLAQSRSASRIRRSSHDRAGHLRQEPRRSRRRHQGARPRAAVESLCRAAMDLRQSAQRPLGPLRPARSAAEIRRRRVSRPVVVGRRQSGQDGNAFVIFATRPTRRRVLALAAGAADACDAAHRSRASADDTIEAHGLSAFGDLAYPADFHHFRYVDPNAPKGGSFSQIGPDRQYNQNFLTFNSLNSYILKGDAAQGMELTFATLMVRCGDEPDAMYGLAAEKVRRSADGLTYRFFIRPQAKFHDGSPLTAHDVAFSLNILKEKGHPHDQPVAARLHRRQGRRRQRALP